MTTTWTTAKIPARRLAAGDRIDANGENVPLTDVITGRTVTTLWYDGHIIEATHEYAVTVHVPDEPVDGYNLWRPKPGTFSYSQCTCVHRRDTDGSWRPLDNDCPACVHRATDDWSD